ncbi:MAG: helix-turn-helix domain-containing protein [Rugosibacter sp.]|nr:helix-turn-helix domain-containing protein [Rugosibacter sp.]
MATVTPPSTGLSTRQSLTHPVQQRSPFFYAKKMTCDADDHAVAMFGADQSCDQMTAGTFSGQVIEMWIEDMQIFRASANRAVCQRGHLWKNYRVIGVPIEMSHTGLLSRQTIASDSLFTFQSEAGFSLSTPKEFDAIAIAVPDFLIDNLMVEHDLGSFQRFISATPNSLNVLSPDVDKLAELRGYLVSILNPCHEKNLLQTDRDKQRGVMSLVISHLIETLRTTKPAPMRSRSFKARSHLVNEAIELGLANPSEPLSIKTLCIRLKVSERMLHYSFLDIVGMAPRHYLRNRRLNGVRRDLKNATSRLIKIHETAAHWGFTHLPRFAADYCTLFGELPSSSLKAQPPFHQSRVF